LTPGDRIIVGMEGGSLTGPVGLALDDEDVRGLDQPVDGDWASSGSAIMASHSPGSRLEVSTVAALRWRSTMSS
jgi:hypothetical protein